MTGDEAAYITHARYGGITMKMEKISVLDSVALADGLLITEERVRERDERRRRRVQHAEDDPYKPYGAFQQRLEALRVRIAADLQTSETQRASAFHPLASDELGFLERQMAVYKSEDRLVVLESHLPVMRWLNILRVNLAVGRTIVSCSQFRVTGRSCVQFQLVAIGRWLAKRFCRGESPLSAPQFAPVLPWRAGLLYGEVFRRFKRASSFWHIGVRRNERTLAAEIYHESVPPPETRDYIHLVCDPMLATGGTQAATIDRLRAEGVAPERIIACAIVAAPEGVDLLLSRYPHLRIVTCALDECLDERGYITGPGLGDFGDLTYGDLDEEYVTERWVTPGLLTRAQAEIILGRMARARAHHGETRAET